LFRFYVSYVRRVLNLNGFWLWSYSSIRGVSLFFKLSK